MKHLFFILVMILLISPVYADGFIGGGGSTGGMDESSIKTLFVATESITPDTSETNIIKMYMPDYSRLFFSDGTRSMTGNLNMGLKKIVFSDVNLYRDGSYNLVTNGNFYANSATYGKFYSKGGFYTWDSDSSSYVKLEPGSGGSGLDENGVKDLFESNDSMIIDTTEAGIIDIVPKEHKIGEILVNESYDRMAKNMIDSRVAEILRFNFGNYDGDVPAILYVDRDSRDDSDPDLARTNCGGNLGHSPEWKMTGSIDNSNWTLPTANEPIGSIYFAPLDGEKAIEMKNMETPVGSDVAEGYRDFRRSWGPVRCSGVVVFERDRDTDYTLVSLDAGSGVTYGRVFELIVDSTGDIIMHANSYYDDKGTITPYTNTWTADTNIPKDTKTIVFFHFDPQMAPEALLNVNYQGVDLVNTVHDQDFSSGGTGNYTNRVFIGRGIDDSNAVKNTFEGVMYFAYVWEELPYFYEPEGSETTHDLAPLYEAAFRKIFGDL